MRDGHRASEVITRLRAMFGKKDVDLEDMDLNEAAGEVVKLSINELKRHQAVVRMEFADGALPIAGDRATSRACRRPDRPPDRPRCRQDIRAHPGECGE